MAIALYRISEISRAGPCDRIVYCSIRSMNTIDSNAAASILPLNPSRFVNDCAPAVDQAPQTSMPPRMADQVTWSPGLWWLLFRYEYLFDGLLPRTSGQETVIYEKPGPLSDGAELSSARPHWNERQAVNPPPALATMAPTAAEIPPAGDAPVSQPVSVEAFVDLMA